ncbi:inositol monophosphatase family protein [Actinokineospora sp. G85]|uniref:inositol monophosphatase family protein n=1 Tax=Actinokineospora sp. G85 TaxID=3406626 RepID=UPI003C74B21D
MRRGLGAAGFGRGGVWARRGLGATGFGRDGVWARRGLGATGFGRDGVWARRGLGATGFGRDGVWARRGLGATGFGRDGVWARRGLGATGFGRDGVWARRGLGATGFGRDGVWARRGLGAAGFGRGGVWVGCGAFRVCVGGVGGCGTIWGVDEVGGTVGSESDVAVAVRAVEAAGVVVRRCYGGVLERFDKGGGDFATGVDLAAEVAVRGVLREARPGDAIVGEEYGGGGGGRTWLVDPLCGTVNFAARTPLVAVNVALRVEGVVVVAVSADPLAGEVFWTAGSGAFLRRGGVDEVVAPGVGDRLVDVNLDPPFPNGASFRAARMLLDDAFVGRFRPRVVSTSLALAWVAAGRRAGYVTDGVLVDSVHFTSGIALCQAAGCVVSNLAGQGVHTGRQGLIAAADVQTHRELVDLVRRAGLEG